MKILVINPKLKVYKNHIDYPYYLNINLYLTLFSLIEKSNLEIDLFDSFNIGIDNVKKVGDYFYFGGEFNENSYSKDYDYILINFSSFVLYSDENIEYINNIIKKYNNSKIIYLNPYTGGFCYIDYKIEHLLEKGLSTGILLNGNLAENLTKELGIIFKENNSINIYSKLYKKINFNNYFKFLRLVSDFGLSDFYKIDFNTLPFYSSKGCIFNCSFCTSSNINIKGFYYYDFKEIEEELFFMKNNLGVEKVILLDALFNKDIESASHILDLFIKYDLKLEIPNGLRLDLLNELLIEKLSKLVTKLSISIESGNQNINNKIIGKGLDLNKIENVGKWAKRHNLKIVSHYIIGFLEETKKDINDTLDFAYSLYEKYNIIPLLQFATPLPGTKLGENLDIDLYKINLYEKFQTDYILSSTNFTKEDLVIFKENFYKKIEVLKTKKIIINLTYACINNCIFCATGDRYKLSQKFSYVIAQLLLYYKKGLKLLDLDGGEPTLYKELFQVIKIAKKIGYQTINVTSSGRRYKNIEYLENLLKTGVDSLLVSIHGTNNTIHDKITDKKGSFEETVLGLNNIFKLRKKYRFSFGINITLCIINESNLEEYLDFVDSWKPDIVNIQFLTPFGNANKLKGLEQNIEKSCDILKKKISKLSYKTQLINLPFCFMEGLEEYVIGDINKMERDMIFVGEVPSNLYEYLAVNRERNEKCNNCKYKIICDGFYKF